MTDAIPDHIADLALEMPLPDGEARRLWIPSDLDSALGLHQGGAYRAIKYDPTVTEGQGYVIARGGLLKRLKALAPGRVPSSCPTLTVLGESAVRRLLDAHAGLGEPEPAALECEVEVEPHEVTTHEVEAPVWAIWCKRSEGAAFAATDVTLAVDRRAGIACGSFAWRGNPQGVLAELKAQIRAPRGACPVPPPILLLCDPESIELVRDAASETEAVRWWALDVDAPVLAIALHGLDEVYLDLKHALVPMATDAFSGLWRGPLPTFAAFHASLHALGCAIVRAEDEREEDAFDLDRDGEEEARRCAEYLERWRQYKQARGVVERAERELRELACR